MRFTRNIIINVFLFFLSISYNLGMGGEDQPWKEGQEPPMNIELTHQNGSSPKHIANGK